jgi:hypothetical protein
MSRWRDACSRSTRLRGGCHQISSTVKVLRIARLQRSINTHHEAARRLERDSQGLLAADFYAPAAEGHVVAIIDVILDQRRAANIDARYFDDNLPSA